MAGVRIREDKGFYIVEAGGRVYRLPKQYVELVGDRELVSQKTGYRFRRHQRGPAHHAPDQTKNSGEAVSAGPAPDIGKDYVRAKYGLRGGYRVV